MAIEIKIIAAVAANRVIGYNNKIPWNIKEDMQHFRDMTSGGIVIMGRNTFESLGNKPLPNRVNIVLTSKQTSGTTIPYGEKQGYTSLVNKTNHVTFFNSLNEAIQFCKTITQITNRVIPVFIIGGARLYKEGLSIASKLILTEIKAEYTGDTYFPAYNKSEWRLLTEQPGLSKEEDVVFSINTYASISRHHIS